MNRQQWMHNLTALLVATCVAGPAAAATLFTVDTDGGGSFPGPYIQDAALPASTLTTTYDPTSDYNTGGKGATPDDDGDGDLAWGGNAGNINNSLDFGDGGDWVQFEIAILDDVSVDFTQLLIDGGDFGSGGRPDGLEVSMAIAVSVTDSFDSSTLADDVQVSPDGEVPVAFTFDLSGYAALQGVGSGDTVYVRAAMFDNGVSSYSQGFDFAEFSGDVTEAVIPEPSCAALLVAGLALVGGRRR